MPTRLIIVESPVKAKTIEKYLGSPYKVLSCNGHIRDLPKKHFGIDIPNGFVPTYVIDSTKEKLIATLAQAAQKAEEVYLASDDDREGEAISFHLQEALHLDPEKTKRITFRAITQKDIQKALAQPRKIDMARVRSQEARRMLDRITGYEGSPTLWRTIKPNLSAGRVQSVALRLIVEQEDAIHHFVPSSHFKVGALFTLHAATYLKAELPQSFSSQEEAHAFLVACQQATFHIASLKEVETQRNPSAPFTTSSLQQAASQQLGFSIKETMNHAQRLYEEGKITYMRTDSTQLSEEAQQAIAQTIRNTFGEDYYQKRTYKSESDVAQEAHEAIRPTALSQKIATDNARAQKLYTLIREHTLASQMKPAVFYKTTAKIAIDKRPEHLVAKGEVLHFKGFLAAYEKSNKAEKEKALPPLKADQKLPLHQMEAKETFTRPPARFTEATLVQKLKDLKIGRPSTYVPIITIIQQRDYVIKDSREGKKRTYQRLCLSKGTITHSQEEETTGTEKNKLYPTDTGIIVNTFLKAYLNKIVDYDFTAQIEKELDKVARQSLSAEKMLTLFYDQFHPQVESAAQADPSIKVRHLGKDPLTSAPIIARFSRRYGPMVQMGELEGEKKPRFASLPPHKLLAYISLEEAIKLFDLPREVGTFEEAPISAHIGRYGPYLKHQNAFYTLPAELDPYSVSEKEAIEVIEEKRKSPQGIIKSFSEEPSITIRAGRFGPYIKTAKRNIKIPKTEDPEKLTLEACKALIEKTPLRKRGAPKRKKKS